MKKKKIKIILFIGLLLILFFPIPLGTYDDGGTRTYMALTYKIVKWNRLRGTSHIAPGAEEDRYSMTSVFWFPDNFKSYEELWKLEREKNRIEVPEDFTISFTWGTFGVSTYDSDTGKLIKKTKYIENTEGHTLADYTTEYHLSDTEKEDLFRLITDMDFGSYPDEYNPYEGKYSSPSVTIIIRVKYKGFDKTISCVDIVEPLGLWFNEHFSPDQLPEKAKKFLRLYNVLYDMLVNSEEWKALPEPEFGFR